MKYILWMVDIFTRFIQGKLITNKRVDTIINGVNNRWCMSVGFPSVGFFADNGGEFSNIKLDELTSKLGLSVKFGPAYSPWSNGLNERNHASADLTIKKMIEEKRVPLFNSLVKLASWTHNTFVNKLGYSLLQLVTGKGLTLPCLTTDNVATESISDSEVVQRTLENLTKIVAEFGKSNMR